MSTVNLGQISAFFSGTSEPINTSLVWQDTSTTPAVHKVFDSTTSTWRLLGDFTLDIRTITINGTTDRISVVGGTQELGDNGVWTVNLATTYIGQTSITTLGTIATGAWQGSVIDETYLDTSLVRDSRTITLNGTTDEIEITGGTQDLSTNRVWTIGLPDNVTIGGDLTVTGDFVVNGTNTAINVTNLTTTDPLIHGANENPNDTLDLGFYWSYNVATTETFSGIFRDTSDSDKSWTFFDSLTEQPTTTVNTAGAGYALGAIKVGKLSSTSILDIESVFINIDSSDILNINSDSGINLQFNGITELSILDGSVDIINDLNVSGNINGDTGVNLQFNGATELSVLNGSVDISGELTLGSGVSSGTYIAEILAGTIANGEKRSFEVRATRTNTRVAEMGVLAHASISSPCAYLALGTEDGVVNYIYSDNADVLRLSANSNDVGTTGGIVIGNQTSDERVKNIKTDPFKYGLEDILKLSDSVIEYSLKYDEEKTHHLGFSAQKAMKVIPEMIYQTNVSKTIEGQLIEKILAIDHSEVIPVLVKSIAELHNMVQLQKQEIELLKSN